MTEPNYLMNWKKLLPCFYKPKNIPSREEREEISLMLTEDEVLIRGVLSPFFYSASKQKLKETIFLPPKGQMTVSLNRLRYTNANFCKQHAKTINFPNNTYCGLATIVNKDIYSVNGKQNDIEVFVQATPINEHGNYIDVNISKIYINSNGLPMHADLTYALHNSDETVEPKTQLRKIASELVKFATYHNDSSPNDGLWSEDSLSESLKKR